MPSLRGVVGWLARRRSSLFLGGGLFVVGFAAGFVVEATTGRAVPESVLGGVGFTLGFLGLLGCYPSIAERRPRLATLTGALAVLGAVGFAVTVVTGLAEVAPFVVPAWLESLVVLNILGLLVGFTAAGYAVLTSGAGSRRLGLLLLAPAGIFAVNFVRVLLRGGPGSETILPEVSAVLAAGQALALLGIGLTLRTEDGTSAGADRPTEAST